MLSLSEAIFCLCSAHMYSTTGTHPATSLTAILYVKPRFVKGEPPSDAAVTAVLQKISRRVSRTLRRRGYLEAGSDAALATRYVLFWTASPNSHAPSWPPSPSASPVGNGLDSTCDGLAQALGMKVNPPH